MTISAAAAKPDVQVAKVVELHHVARQGHRDREFLPAALEILETPPSPIRVTLMLSICALATCALILSWVGRIDVVAVAQGKIQPTGRVKVVQSLETGRVRAIRAENGLHVQAGEVLVELDPTEVDADEAALRISLAAFEAEAMRRREAIRTVATAATDSLMLRPVLPLAFAPTTPLAIRAREERVLMSDLTQLQGALESLAAQIRQKEAERARLIGTIAVQHELVATLRERVTMRATLLAHDAGTKAGLIDATETLQYQEGALATQLGQLAETNAGFDVLAREMRKSRETFIAENEQKLADAERQADDLSQRLAKARAHTEHMTLRAPLSGVVQGSSITTVGQVVTPSEELMRIVPDGSALEIEAYLQNRDVGFVRDGQEATIKIESLPFTRYGIVTGTVLRVASDAIPEPDAQQVEGNPAKAQKSNGFTGGAQRTQNLVFPLLVRPDKTSLMADGRDVALAPGMAVSVEVKTGRRRILEYLFSPVAEVGASALHER